MTWVKPSTGGGGGGTGPQGPAGQGYTWRGAYNAATQYEPYDCLSYQGSSYVCTVASLGNAPTNTSYFAPLALEGNQGIQGPAGANGSNGLNGTSFVWRGVYSSVTNYNVNDCVLQNGTSYVCIQAGSNNPPNQSPSCWTVLAQGLNFRNAYNAGVQYFVNDVVTYNGGTYIATATTLGNAPTDTGHWTVMAASGVSGTSLSVSQQTGDPVTMAQYQELQFTIPSLTNFNALIDVFEQVNNVSAMSGDNTHQLSGAINSKMVNNSVFTLEFWQKTTANESSKYNLVFGSNHLAILNGYTAGVLEFYSVGYTGTNPRNANSQIPIPDTNWNHYAWTYDGATLTAYRNGTVINSQAIAFTLPITAADTLYVFGGNAANTYLANTSLDELRFWSTCRTQTQIQNFMNQTPVGQTGLVALYNFDENSAGATVKDQSNYGTAVNLTNAGNLPYVTAGIPTVNGYVEKCSTGKYNDPNPQYGLRLYNQTTVGVRKNSPGSAQVYVNVI